MERGRVIYPGQPSSTSGAGKVSRNIRCRDPRFASRGENESTSSYIPALLQYITEHQVRLIQPEGEGEQGDMMDARAKRFGIDINQGHLGPIIL